ncbi:MAG: hypothetical protein Q3979_01620 [Actinomycetaceae bacterium]|nr:hypothetical protein [Actinomycetaceae bacterium]
MFEITGVGTILLSLAATIGAAFAAITCGPRLVFDGRRAALGVLARAGLVAVSCLLGFVTVLLVFNRATGTVSAFSEVIVFFQLVGIVD